MSVKGIRFVQGRRLHGEGDVLGIGGDLSPGGWGRE